jgi:hypothetical protein
VEAVINGGYVTFTVTPGEAVYPITIDPTLESQPDGTDGEDTFIHSTNAFENSGTGIYMYVGDRQGGSDAGRILIRFPGVSAIPEGVTVTGATLSLYEYFASGGTFSVSVNAHRVLRAWVEGETTWTIYSTGNNWGTAGCSADTDRVADVSATVTLDQTAANDFIAWSSAGMIADVQSWVDGGANEGWMIRSDAEFDGAGDGTARNFFRTSDYTTAAQRPKLVVDYEEASSGSSCSFVGVSTCGTGATSE